MAITTRDIPALPDQVWAVLADPLRYAEWVVGAQEVRCFDGEWPEPGARFHHRVGLGPVHIHDDTWVLESTPPRRLVLRARVRPFGHARVALELFACEAGTRVEIEHAGWERLGDAADAWRERNVGGWTTLLPYFVAATTTPGEGAGHG